MVTVRILSYRIVTDLETWAAKKIRRGPPPRITKLWGSTRGVPGLGKVRTARCHTVNIRHDYQTFRKCKRNKGIATRGSVLRLITDLSEERGSLLRTTHKRTGRVRIGIAG